MDKRSYKDQVGILLEDIDYLQTQIKYYGTDKLDDLQIKYEYQVELNVKQGQLYKLNQDWFTVQKYQNQIAPLVDTPKEKLHQINNEYSEDDPEFGKYRWHPKDAQEKYKKRELDILRKEYPDKSEEDLEILQIFSNTDDFKGDGRGVTWN
tara:strand:- start:89 stop:541 length:453 start_codon:yes stop_codon:yes gene_type:complete